MVRAENPEWYYLNTQLLKVTCTNYSSVYSVGTNGVLLRSSDKGLSWKQIPTGISDALLNVAFSDSLHGTIVGDNGIIIATTDAGVSWKLQRHGMKALRCVVFLENSGMIVGDSGTILRTEDRGKNWFPLQSPTNDTLHSIVMLTDRIILIGASNGKILRSIDNGNTWSGINNPIFNTFYRISDISVSAEGKIFALAVKDKFSFLLVSADSAKTWNSNTITLPDRTNGITFPNSNFGFAVGNGSQIQFSKDGGRSYTPQTGFDSSLMSVDHLYSISFMDQSIGFAVGGSKTIYRTDDSGNHWKLLSFLPNFDRGYSSAQFITEDIGYIGYDSYGLILRTINGGSTWLPQRTSATDTIVSGSKINSLFFYDTQTGIACPLSSGRSVLRTTDGGENYSQTSFITLDYPQICSPGPNLTIIISTYIQGYSQSIISVSTDKGISWSRTVKDSISLNKIFYLPNNLYYFLGSYQTPEKQFNSTIFKSRDTGHTLEKTPVPEYVKNFTSIYFFDENNGVATALDNSYKPLILRTVDGCKSWIVVDSSLSQLGALPALIFSDKLHGYIGSQSGVILETIDGGKSWRKSPSLNKLQINTISVIGNDITYAIGGYKAAVVMKKLPQSFYTSVSEPKIAGGTPTVSLYSPRPLPTTGKVRIDAIWVQNIDVSTIRIKLYDMLGVELKDITDSFYPNFGSNTGIVELDCSNIQTGIYYVEIRGGGGRKSVPIVIAR